MTIWLWLIGAGAFVWPIIVAAFVYRDLDRQITRNARADAHMREQRAETRRLDLAKVHAVAEQHDALLAALWQRTFGFQCVNGLTWESLPAYLGVKPEWQGFAPELNRPVAYLVRYDPYPWGSSAEHLYFDR